MFIRELDEKTILLDGAFLECLKEFLRLHPEISFNIEEPINIDLFRQKINRIVNEYSNKSYDISEENARFYNITSDLIEKYQSLISILEGEYLELVNSGFRTDPDFYKKDVNIYKLMNFIYLLTDKDRIHQEVVHFSRLLKDLPSFYDSLFKVLSKEEFDEYKKVINSLIEKRDSSKLKPLLISLNNLIKKDWIKNITYPEINCGKFNFVGHSVNHLGEFSPKRQNYTSCSLFTDEVFRPFHYNFGFIMDSKDIVAASGHDLYVYNDAKSLDNLITGSAIPIINHYKVVEEESKKDNKIYNIIKYSTKADDEAINEVVVKGFNPIGIFRITLGGLSTELDYTLFERFLDHNPGYIIYSYDVLKLHPESESLRRMFIYNINNYVYKNDLSRPGIPDDINRFNLFFDRLAILKEGRYTEDDLRREYLHNEKILYESVLDIDNIEHSRNIIRYSYTYNLEVILKGRIKDFMLRNLINTNEDLDIYFEGLNDLVSALKGVTINESLVESLNNLSNRTIESITTFIKSYGFQKKKDL